ncbi:MAG TPA: hydrophobe/amphiphile efflux-1 family RND transporter [Maribacter sp.]|uniref:efflux RND transporter permease subunit n=1 Tax=unclassified Maribacter TaxID=2615042 RepID=UPI000ECE18B3|nr:MULTISPECIES: efflux RND transporter permease subunit [unclassified Maribacter]HAF77356.1 hydrophobe/amphiphile efflux-1 family RND transporter [Maribacter sp.]|tara:strand:+ start:212051 stop:215188 length:3138 start_codon:yes stop_codon:yes gene_type:complete
MFQKFIDRPVLSTVISIIIVILGVLGLSTLPIEEYPEIAPPTVQVTSTYTGANAETVLKSVVVPLEEQINGVEDMLYMTSNASNDGSATINVYFKLGTDPDIAAVNVQNRVARANSVLPQAVIQTGVITQKSQTSALLFFSLFSENDNYDATFVENYARINLVPKLQRIEGVGNVTVFGAKDYSMRIWLDPAKMAAYKLMPSDIQAALNEQNLEAATGKIGENADGVYEYVLKYKGRLSEEEEYEDIIIRAQENGQFLRLKDVAELELGAFNYGTKNEGMGNPGTAVGVFQTSGSNANEIIDQIQSILQESQPDFPDGLDYVIPYNTKDFLSASIEHVVQTLIEAFLLVFLVVFLFLQDFRSTLIPAIAVPVAIIGTFFFLSLFGYSINMLTLFAMILAIGIVVDDAIVVVEAVHAKMEEGATNAKTATKSAMSEISGAIISITLVMSAVFIPVSFISGSSGVFYQQFGITLAIAILISAVNALTLSPALAALFLKPHNPSEEHKKGLKQRFFTAFNTGFDTITDKYVGSVKVFAKNKWLTIGSLVVFTVITIFMFKTTPTGFIPNEDKGIIFADVTMPPGTTLEETQRTVKQLDSIYESMDIVKARMNITGFSILNSVNGGSYGFSVIRLQDWEERTEPSQTVDATIGQLFAKTAGLKNARIFFFTPPAVRGFGNSAGFELNLQNKDAEDWQSIGQTTNEFLAALNARPEVQYAITSFNPNFPQYELQVDIEKTKSAGLAVTDVFNAMQGYYGGLYTTDFNKFGKQYRVMIQAKPEDRANEESLNHIFVTNANGESVAVSQFVSLQKIYGPEIVSRFNLLNSVKINGAMNPGYSTGDAITAIEEVSAQVLPNNYTYEYSGLTKEENSAGSQTIIIFILSLVFVYFLLSAQYESYILPFSILLSLPVGIAGAIGFVSLFGLENNIYFQIALIMLIGLLSKNAILIVEFALQRRKHGMSIMESAIDGAKARLRPILMTSFAFILGLLPLALSSGIGAVGNRSIGMSAVGGMLIGTIFGVFVIPALYVIFQSIQERFTGAPKEAIEK